MKRNLESINRKIKKTVKIDESYNLQQRLFFLVLPVILLAIFTQPVCAQHFKTLQAQSESEQKRILQSAINSAGYPCSKITVIFFMGNDRDDAGYWSVACSDGGNWVVQVKNDAAGTLTVTPCEIMERVGVKCWKKFE